MWRGTNSQWHVHLFYDFSPWTKFQGGLRKLHKIKVDTECQVVGKLRTEFIISNVINIEYIHNFNDI